MLDGTQVAQVMALGRARLVQERREICPLHEGITIPVRPKVTLEAGKRPLALYGLWANLVQGESVQLALRFERAGEVAVIARVPRVDAAGNTSLPVAPLGDSTVSLASTPPAAGP